MCLRLFGSGLLGRAAFGQKRTLTSFLPFIRSAIHVRFQPSRVTANQLELCNGCVRLLIQGMANCRSI